MEYRPIGNTGMQASVVGLGCEHLDNKPYELVQETIRAALDAGVNILDVFMPGQPVRQNIGKALGSRRKDVLLQGHIGSVDLNQQYDISRDLPTCKKYFENLLRDLGTDYIDFGMLFFLDTQEAYQAVFEGEIIEYALDLKRKGVIRGIGGSSHNPVIASKAVASGLLDILMFSINPAFDMVPAGASVLDALDGGFAHTQLAGLDPARAQLYQQCQRQGVAVTVMKTLGGGKLLQGAQSPFGQALSVGQCIHYAVSRPAVVSALVGCAGAQQVRQAVNYLEMSEEERDYSAVISHFAAGQKPACVYCNHCQPCPAGIDIAAATKFYDIAALEDGPPPPSLAAHYKALAHHGGNCVACGSCMTRCPFGVNVIDNMKAAKQLFGY